MSTTTDEINTLICPHTHSLPSNSFSIKVSKISIESTDELHPETLPRKLNSLDRAQRPITRNISKKIVSESSVINDPENLNNCRRIASELIENEKSYVFKLKILKDVVKPKIDADLSKFKFGLGLPSHLKSCLSGMMKIVPQLYKLHKICLDDVVDSSDYLQMGSCMVTVTHYFQLYPEYYHFYEEFKNLGGLSKWRDSSVIGDKWYADLMGKIEKEFKIDGKTKNRNKNNSSKKSNTREVFPIHVPHIDEIIQFRDQEINQILKQGLDSLFDAVFQQVPRYTLLLDRYANKLPENLPDKKLALMAVANSRAVNFRNNEVCKIRAIPSISRCTEKKKLDQRKSCPTLRLKSLTVNGDSGVDDPSSHSLESVEGEANCSYDSE